jgi:hypothetical protein
MLRFGIIFLTLLTLCEAPTLAQSNSQPFTDSFNSNSSYQGLGPDLSDVPGIDIFSDGASAPPFMTNAELEQKIEYFTTSLPNDPMQLMGILDKLLRKRIANWHYPNQIELTLWIRCCQAILGKSGGQSGTLGGWATFQRPSAQDALRYASELRCVSAFTDAYYTVLQLFPHNGGEEEEPIASQHRAQALQAVTNAEIICHLAPRSPQRQTLPPLAPQRPVFNGQGNKSNPIPDNSRSVPQNPIQIATVDGTLDRRTGTLTVTDQQTHKSVSVHVYSGNSQYGIGYPGGQGADGRYDDRVDEGPIPKGDYLIGNGYKERAVSDPHPNGDARWYPLYGANGHGGYSLERLWNGRGVLYLHTGLRTNGCVTIPSDVPETAPNYPTSSKYNELKNLLDNTKPLEYKPNDFYRGWLHVM